ncbi:hypothetical protein EDC02_5922 [Micromonospora sp. Llam0]|uniref:hypothetical protein n=1 Tax=Micromonospora sp. Llam0 TaxID=2485143 RepID=UPI000F9506E7|nr:hypothetical protein [Micromonospora sp. Llam0]ROO51058.1 hypothetical protein EDC02_5922 [Micromonospora sp. Llam0]
MDDPIARLREERDLARAAAAIAEAQCAIRDALIDEQQELIETLRVMALDAADHIQD